MKLKDHYDNHLSHFYAWMIGSFDEAQQIQEAFLRKHNIISATREHAIDLGAGHGLQAISLAKLGYHVTAVDFTKNLLTDLQGRAGTLSIRCVQEDILRYLEHNSDKAEIITCMGDTLTHLESVDQVEKLVQQVSDHLDVNGKFVVSFRDLTHELTGDQRFIPVRSDEKRILTCFLEYFPDRVIVHDIFHEHRDGTWIQKVSSYPKLRLNQQLVENLFSRNHIEIIAGETINRMIYLVGRKVNAPR
ncbi:MAG TPA: class I SAM-dependent methyltransferase [Ohtaekwangia sp.]